MDRPGSRPGKGGVWGHVQGPVERLGKSLRATHPGCWFRHVSFQSITLPLTTLRPLPPSLTPSPPRLVWYGLIWAGIYNPSARPSLCRPPPLDFTDIGNNASTMLLYLPTPSLLK